MRLEPNISPSPDCHEVLAFLAKHGPITYTGLPTGGRRLRTDLDRLCAVGYATFDQDLDAYSITEAGAAFVAASIPPI